MSEASIAIAPASSLKRKGKEIADPLKVKPAPKGIKLLKKRKGHPLDRFQLLSSLYQLDFQEELSEADLVTLQELDVFPSGVT